MLGASRLSKVRIKYRISTIVEVREMRNKIRGNANFIIKLETIISNKEINRIAPRRAPIES